MSGRIIALILAFSLTAGSLSQSYSSGPSKNRPAFPWPAGKKLAISLTFDDARLSQADKGISLLDKYGVKATFYISPNSTMQRLEAWKKALQTGHEIGNHSLVHPCMGNFEFARDKALEDYDLSYMKSELDSAGRFISETFGVTALSFAYPCGQTFIGSGVNTKSYVPLIAAMFESGRGWLGESPNDPWYCNMSQLTGIELDGKSFEQILDLINAAASKGQWLLLAGHEMSDGGRQTSLLSTIDQLCKYASDPAIGIWIDNVHNIAAWIREQRGEGPFTRLPVYKDALFSTKERVDDLLSRMTIEEKIGQMNMPCVYVDELGKDVPAKTDACLKLAEGKFPALPGPAGGFFTLANTILHEGTLQQANFFNQLQKTAVEKTRLGIPLLQTKEGTHGLMCTGGTIFPEGLALGSTWNMDLVSKIYSIAAREARAVGIHQIFTLVIEPNRNPRLGRNQEGYSEDPYFCSRMAETIVNAVQGNDITAPDKTIAGLCHYPGQSQPISGLDRGSMEISERKLREVFLPPWFAGINTVKYMGLASTDGEAGMLNLQAGLDVGISFEDGFIMPMIENVKEGKVSMHLIDRAVRRILELKFRLGLFENPYVNPDRAVKVTHTEESRGVALEAAREGIVLLRNENNTVPLKKNLRRIAVIGPNADNEKNQFGDYTANVVNQDIVTVLEGIRSSVAPGTIVDYVKGCNVTGTELNEISKAVQTARKADVAIVVLGENEWQSPKKTGTDGEGYDVATLELTGMQENLLKAIKATGKPVVLVLINGRPLAVMWAAENIPAILEAWIPGEEGGTAIADILFGDYNPSRKLTITVPRHAGQRPVYYDYMPSKEYWLENAWGKPYADMLPTPLWEFGFGLSYTKFEYSNLRVEPAETGTFGEIMISADVKNTGPKEGKEVVQLYIRDLKASVEVPVKELKGFEKVSLAPGETKSVKFIVTHEDLMFLDRSLTWVVESGDFQVLVGSSSADIRLKGNFILK